MSQEFFVKPASPDRKVRKPSQRREYLAADGETVPRDAYWLRRLQDGDVVQAEPPKAAAPAPKSK